MKLGMKNEKVVRECKATPLRVSLPLSLRAPLPLSLRAIAKQSPGSNSHLTLRYFLSLLFFIFLNSHFLLPTSTFAATYTVTVNTDSGAGSLRQAITDANASAGADTINFTISPQTITPLTQLPALSDATGGTTIDATGQNITIDGNGASFYGFRITSANNAIKGLTIINFSSIGYAGVHITGASATNNTISGNKIGNDGTTAYANYHGVLIDSGAPGNIIGGATAGERNIISGNSSRGVYIGDANTNNNQVQGNYIGTDVNGTAAIPNNEGVLITSAQSNIIGGTTAGERNIISGNTNYGVFIINPNTNNNVVQGNYIGTDVSGTTALGNSYGVYIASGAQSNIIGGTSPAERNIISGNTIYGVYIRGANTNNNQVKGNYIGTDVSGTTALANGYGVYITAGAQSNIIGGTTAGEGNVIAFNISDGVWVQDDWTDKNKISGNKIHSNGGLGIDLSPDGVTANDAGDVDTGPNENLNFPVIVSVVQTATNVYTVSGTAPANAVVELFRVDNTLTGCTPDGTGYGEAFSFLGSVTAGAGGDWSIPGITITGGTYVTATTTDTSGNTSEFAKNMALNTIVVTNNNNTGNGSLRQAITDANLSIVSITITFAISSATITPASQLPSLTGGDITIDGTGQNITIDGNGASFYGFEITSANNAIKGLTIKNFSGVGYAGIHITGASATNNTISGNKIGNNGTTAYANYHGVLIDSGAQSNIIGGTTAGERNIISGNNYGVYIGDANTNNNQIKGNYIGTDVSGTTALANWWGIHIGTGAQSNIIGGTTAGERNIISGNSVLGVGISGSGTNSNEVKGNYIGTDVNGTTALANNDSGVLIYTGAQSNIIGGTTAGERNIISGNTGHGVYISGVNTNNNQVKGNYIGTDVSGTTALANQYGIWIDSGAQSNIIGGTTAGERNIISGNTNCGVYISGVNTNNNEIKGNYIGTDVNGTAAIANGYGVVIYGGAQSNIIGGPTAGERNIISGNTGYGVYIGDVDTNNNQVQGNYIGTDVTGTAAIANGFGVFIEYGAQSNIIGGTTAGEGNVIAFNISDGVWVQDDATDKNKISANKIHSNGGLGIDLSPDGVTLNDSVGHTGPNENLNFPVIVSVVQTATDVYTVSGTAPANATVELFRVDNTLTGVTPDPTEYGEAYEYLVSTNADGVGDWSIAGVTIIGGSWITATAIDTNNNTSEFTQNFDITPPSDIATVNDGTGADITYTTSTTELSANWTASTDAQSGVVKYWYAIGTTQGGTEVSSTILGNVDGWLDNGLNLSVTKTGLSLTNGQIYYFTVKAENGAGLINQTPTSSNGQTVDTSPPSNITTVNDGTGADITYTTSTTQLSANWSASTDAQSGVVKYWYAIGKTAGGTDVVGWTDNGLSTSVTKTGLTLTNGQIYYFTVKAENGAGLMNETPTSSNGQTVVTTSPNVDTLSSSTHPNQTNWYSNNLPSFSWTGSGGSSGLAGYYYLLDQTSTQTNTYVQTNGAWTTGTSYTYTTAKSDGIWYFHIIAKNNLDVLSDVSNWTAKIDALPPSNIATVNDGTGADITYTTSTTQLSANWTASSDAQSGVVKYWYAIGTTAGETNVVGWTDNGTNTSVTKTGLSLTNGQIYYFTVKAENGAGLINQTPTSSNGQTVVDTTPPLVSITSPLANASLTETVEIIGTASDAYLKEYRLEYGAGSNPAEWKLLSLGESSVVESVLATWDTSSLTGTYTLKLQAGDTSDNSQEVKVLVTIHNSSELGYSLPSAIWRMISLPFTPENPDPAILFALSNLKLYYWDPTAKEDADYSRWRVPDEITPGRAYWIRVPEGTSLNLTGSLVDQSEDFLVHLYSGWNQIGNPFAFDLNWGEVKVKHQGETVSLDTALSNNWTVNYIYWYENGGYSQATSPDGLLAPGSGYWFWSWEECELVIPPIQSAGKVKGRKLTQINTDSDWMLKIGARVGDYNDLDNYIGVGENSLDEYDRYDAFEPPVLGDYVSLYFPHSDWSKYSGRYANDFRQRTEKMWEMVVETNLKNTQVSLNFEEVVPLPSGYQAKIVDLATNETVILLGGSQEPRAKSQEPGHYSYNSGSGGKRHFRIIVGKESEMGGGPDQPLSLQVYNFPNPDTTGNTTFKYNASPNLNRVVIEVYNLAGRLVDRFEDLTPTDGRYEWPFGRRLANGVYIYRITVEDIYGRKASSTGKLAVLR